MNYLKRFLFWIIVLAVLAAVGTAALWPQPAVVEIAQVKRGRLEVAVQEEGRTRIKDRYVVSAPVSGQLLRVELKPGDSLKNGDTLLATIQPGDPSLLDARQVSQARAAVESAKIQVERADARIEQVEVAAQLAETQYGRAKELKQQASISEAEYEKADAEYRNSQEALRVASFESEIAKFELQQAEAALQHFTSENDGLFRFEIRSPIDGQVLRVFQESATVVIAGSPLLEVGNPTDLEVVVDVLSSDAVKIEIGNGVKLTQWGGDATLFGEVSVIEPAAFTRISSLGVEEQRVNVIADFREPRETIHRLGDGFRVAAHIIVWQEDDVLQVPNAAIFRVDQKWSVFVVRDGRARLTAVELGKRNEHAAQVLGGLTEGDVVIQYPSDLIEDGSLVQADSQ